MRGGKRKGAGRPPGPSNKPKKIKSTIHLFQEDWDKLDKIGPSRGRAIEKLLKESNL